MASSLPLPNRTLTPCFPLFHVVIQQESQLLTEEMRELLSGVTRSAITDLEERSPFGPSARARGDVTAEQRWLYLRGSSHSTSLLRSMMMVAEEVAARVDGPSSTFSATSPRAKPSSTNDSAEDLSVIFQRSQNSTNGAKKSASDSPVSNKSKSKSNATSASAPSGTFSWTSYLKSADVDTPEPAVGATTTRRKSAGATNDVAGASRSPPPGSSSPPPASRSNKTGTRNERSSSTMHRRLGRDEMKTFGLVPLDDTPRLLQCPTCQRILMDHIYTSHTLSCRYIPPVKPEPVRIEPVARQTSTPPPSAVDAIKRSASVNSLPVTSYSPLPTTTATPPPGLAKVSNGRPTIKQSAARQAQSGPIVIDTKQAHSAKPTATARSSTQNVTVAASTAPPASVAAYPPRSYAQVASAPSAAAVPAAVTPVCANQTNSNASPQTPPARASPASQPYSSPNGSVVMVTSPRSGLKASIGQSVAPSSAAALPPTAPRYQTPYYNTSPPQATTSTNVSPTSASYAPPYLANGVPVQTASRPPAKRSRQETLPAVGSSPIATYSMNQDPAYASKRVSYGVPPPGPSPSRSINASRNASPAPAYAAAAARATFTTTPTKSIMVPSAGPSKRPPLASPTPVHAQHMPSSAQPMNWVRTASMAPTLTGNSNGPSFAPTFSSLPAASYQVPQNEPVEEFVSPAAFQGTVNVIDPDYAMFAEDSSDANSYFPPTSADDLFP